jgi:hypothetical protein
MSQVTYKIDDYKDINVSQFYVSTGSSYAFVDIPPKVGYYRIGGNYGLSIAFTKKPIWFHRKMMALCLGWEWIDGNPLG